MQRSRRKYRTKDVSGWKGLVGFYTKNFSRSTHQASAPHGQAQKRPKWIFRGQRLMAWELKTTLDRAFEKYEIREDEGYRRDIEKRMLRSFMRKAHHYMAHEPSSDDLLEWLAIMRHYGAPTRMLDWTYSFYVAVYNAVENWDPEKQNANKATATKKAGRENPKKRAGKNADGWPVLWALDAHWLKPDPFLCILERWVPDCIDRTRYEQNSVVKYLMETPAPQPLVYNATGFRLNERLTAQQGTFLVQGTLAKTFSENLEASLGKGPKKPFWRICLKIDGARRDEILCELNNMNINHATLYPDLEGFAKSLERHMAYPENWGLAIEKQY